MKKVTSLIVVGGGSSGWMAAAYFSNLFPSLKVTLIKSRNISVIGVGGATVPFLHLFMSKIGYPDPPFLDASLRRDLQNGDPV